MDKEEIIRRLKEISEHAVYTTGKPLFLMSRNDDIALNEAVRLLKEQEAVEPKLVGVNTWTCGECGALIGWEEFARSGLELVKYKFCAECGKVVKWK